jgi:hypothetical protein
MAKYCAVSKTLTLKRGIEIKRDHGTAYNSYGESFQVRILDTGSVNKPIWKFVAKRADIVNTVLSNGAAVAGTKEINDFVLVPVYSSTLTLREAL